jgi:hypothetical protein
MDRRSPYRRRGGKEGKDSENLKPKANFSHQYPTNQYPDQPQTGMTSESRQNKTSQHDKTVYLQTQAYIGSPCRPYTVIALNTYNVTQTAANTQDVSTAVRENMALYMPQHTAYSTLIANTKITAIHCSFPAVPLTSTMKSVHVILCPSHSSPNQHWREPYNVFIFTYQAKIEQINVHTLHDS